MVTVVVADCTRQTLTSTQGEDTHYKRLVTSVALQFDKPAAQK